MKSALAKFQTLPLKDAARQLLAELGYRSDKFLVGAGSKPQDFLDDFASGPELLRRCGYRVDANDTVNYSDPASFGQLTVSAKRPHP